MCHQIAIRRAVAKTYLQSVRRTFQKNSTYVHCRTFLQNTGREHLKRKHADAEHFCRTLADREHFCRTRPDLGPSLPSMRRLSLAYILTCMSSRYDLKTNGTYKMALSPTRVLFLKPNTMVRSVII